MEESETLVGIIGRVKWFNQFKGYGFVEAEGIPEDVFLHFSALTKSGTERLGNNDIILCNIVKSGKGYQVSEVAELLKSNKYEVGQEEPKTTLAKMKWFNPSKGFGFALMESGEDVFIHSSLLKRHKKLEIEPGEEIRMIIRKTNFGYEAVDIIP